MPEAFFAIDEIIKAKLYCRPDQDPGATTAVITSPDGGTTKRSMALAGLKSFVAAAKPTVVGGTGLTKLEIVCADDAALTSNLTVVKDSGTIQNDALDDFTILEATLDDILAVSLTAEYVGARLTMATNTDEAAVVYIGHAPRWAFDGQAASVQA